MLAAVILVVGIALIYALSKIGVPNQTPMISYPTHLNSTTSLQRTTYAPGHCSNEQVAPLNTTPLQGMVANMTFGVCNDEASGNGGYWAIGNYTKNVQLRYLGSNTYLGKVTLNGTWHTIHGARSPGNATIEPANGSGTFYGVWYAQIPGKLNTSLTSNGFIGSFNFNGTYSDLLKPNGNQTGPSNVYNWLYYRLDASVAYIHLINDTTHFTYMNQTYTSTLVNNTFVSKGDIVT